jgi:NADPH:quinone reductase-like Zn-dependent oxidoreductase
MKSRHLTFRNFGAPSETLELEDFETAALKQDEVLLEIEASPINPADLNYIEGTYGIKPELPSTAGIECCATVLESLSPNFQAGDKVIPISKIGGWADHAVTHDRNLIRLPANIDPVQAAMLKVNPATAMLLLTHFENLKPGDWVTLNASNSGVGQCVASLAKEFGIQTVCFLRNLTLEPELKALGATHVFEDSSDGFDQAKQRLGKNRAKLAFNAVGGDSALRLMKLLGKSGTHITYGAMARKPLTIPNGPLIFNDLRIRGLWVTQWMESCEQGELQETYTKLAEMTVSGALHQKVDSLFELSNFHKALQRIEAEERSGKVIFTKKARN